MKRLILILTTVVAGCGSIDNLVSNMPCPGHRPYDPQTCRGEKFARLPNFTNEAQRIMERCGSIGADCPKAKEGR
jgi:hypothetical protein